MKQKNSQQFKITKVWPHLLFAMLCAMLMAARPACRPPPTLDSEDFHVYVAPGTCVDIDNPCAVDGSWAEIDHFRLYDEPDNLFVRGVSDGTTVVRQICAADDVAELDSVQVTWLYTEVNAGRRTEYGEGFVYITTIVHPSFTVDATATPQTIELGDSSLLVATCDLGTPPYTYVWWSEPSGVVPSGQIISDSVWVKPTVNTLFTVASTDHVGEVDTDTVSVLVGFNVAPTVTPDTIIWGSQALLQANVVGGTPPYTFSWVPVASINNSTIADPIANPQITTTYQLTVNDGAGNIAVGTAKLVVRMSVDADATPAYIEFGDSTQLTVTVRGGKPPYSYLWSPTGSLSDSTATTLWAKPTSTTTYAVTVTDADSMQTVDSVTVTVGGGLDACFTWAAETPPEINVWERVDFHPQCSQGDIVAWLWWFGFNEGSPGPYNDSLSYERSYDIMFDAAGDYVVRLNVYDSQGNSDNFYDTLTVIAR